MTTTHPAPGGLDLDLAVPARDVHLRARLDPGTITAVLGPNGAGKSTLLQSLAGDITARGHARLDGVDLLSGRPGHRGVVHLGQDPVLFTALSVLHNVAFPLECHGHPRREARSRARELLRAVEMEEFTSRRPDMLSGGQQQRVALARALALDPQVVLLDEPFAALDIDGSARLRSLVSRTLAGRTVLLVTHDLLDVLSLATHVLALEAGRVVQSGTRPEVLSRPRSEVAARMAGRILLHGTIREADRIEMRQRVLRGMPDGNLAPDGPGLALLDPTQVSLLRHGVAAESDSVVVDGEVSGLDLHGGHVLVRVGELAAALDAETAAAEPVTVGEQVRLVVPPSALRLYAGEHEHPQP